MRLVHLLFLLFASGFLLAQDPVQSFYLDLGPNDGTNGNATASPDANGNTWNNLTLPAGGETVTLVNTAGTASNYRVSLTTGMRGNGINHGGLLAPDASVAGDNDPFFQDCVKAETDDKLAAKLATVSFSLPFPSLLL